MYTTHQERRARGRAGHPLVLHVRALRQWHGDTELSQRELARRAGICVRALHKYETCRQMPQQLTALHALAQELTGGSLDALFDPRLLRRIRENSSEAPPPWLLSIAYVSPYFALAVITATGAIALIEVKRLAPRRHRRRLHGAITALTRDYALGVVVSEPRYLPLLTAARGGSSLRALTLSDAAAVLLPDAVDPCHHRLYAHLVACYPQLERFTHGRSAEGRLFLGKPSAARLRAVALGLAARQMLGAEALH